MCWSGHAGPRPSWIITSEQRFGGFHQVQLKVTLQGPLETSVTIWTVTNHAVWGIGALPYGNNPPNLFIFNKCSVCECPCNKCTSGAMLLRHWENVNSSSPRHAQEAEKEKHGITSIGAALLWCRKQIKPVSYSWNSCFGLQALVLMHILLFYRKWDVFNKDLLPSYRYRGLIKESPDRGNWIRSFHG